VIEPALRGSGLLARRLPIVGLEGQLDLVRVACDECTALDGLRVPATSEARARVGAPLADDPEEPAAVIFGWRRDGLPCAAVEIP
jgi:hypothetical protein